MEIKLSKKEFDAFLDNIDGYVKYFINELNSQGIQGKEVVDFEKKIYQIQSFLEKEFHLFDEEKKNKLRLSFWAFFSKLLMERLGGILRLAPKSDYCDGTPQLIDFGKKYDKKGKKKWLAIGFDSWFNGIIEKKILGTLNGTIEHIIQYYS